MIRNTFIFIPGVGDKTERSLWRRGILTWEDLLEDLRSSSQNQTKKKNTYDHLLRANEAIEALDAAFFSEHLPQKEYWRLYPEFYKKTLFLDIETTGLSLYYHRITMIGTFDGYKTRIFIRDNNFDEFYSHIAEYEVLVTFNGKRFDVPFIKKEFPNIKLPPVHIDLMYLLRTIGLKGPLKKIESELGIGRAKDISEIDGKGATVLWHRFLRGDSNSLQDLILYNMHDTVNLQTIMSYCYEQKAKLFELEINREPHQLRLDGSEKSKAVEYRLPHAQYTIPRISIEGHKNDNRIWIRTNSDMLLAIDREKIQVTRINIERLIRIVEHRGFQPVVVGIDLSASEKKVSGVCILRGRDAYIDLVNSDDEIMTIVAGSEPTVISIDAPLGLPRGRRCIDDSSECRIHGITRECERILMSRGINIYPCLIKSMQKVTERGIDLAKFFRDKGYTVIESYPGVVQDILEIPRRKADFEGLVIDLTNMGIKPRSDRPTITHDEADAITSALLGYFFLSGDYEAVGDKNEELLIIPALDNL